MRPSEQGKYRGPLFVVLHFCRITVTITMRSVKSTDTNVRAHDEETRMFLKSHSSLLQLLISDAPEGSGLNIRRGPVTCKRSLCT